MYLDWSQMNYAAILAGGLLYIVYGSIYYSILLSEKRVQQYDGVKNHQKEGPVKYIAAIIIAFISSSFIAILTQATSTESITAGAAIGVMIGMIISLVYLKNFLFGLMSKTSFLIAIGDHVVIFTLLGALHGLL